MSQFGPHSSRGAAVLFYKRLWFSSEQVAELGKWKNLQAFHQHYLRLDASCEAGSAIEQWVHKVSHGDCAEPDWSSTPRTQRTMGGMDQEGDAQDTCETTLEFRHLCY